MSKGVIFNRIIPVSSKVTMSFGGSLVSLQAGDEVEYTVRRVVKRKLDWSKVPKGTLITVDGEGMNNAYFNCVCPVSGLVTYYSDIDDFIKQNITAVFCTDRASLAPAERQPWMPWFGGECPLPRGVLVEVCYRSLCTNSSTTEVVNLRWEHRLTDAGLEGGIGDIIAYRIKGLAEGWVH